MPTDGMAGLPRDSPSSWRTCAQGGLHSTPLIPLSAHPWSACGTGAGCTWWDLGGMAEAKRQVGSPRQHGYGDRGTTVSVGRAGCSPPGPQPNKSEYPEVCSDGVCLGSRLPYWGCVPALGQLTGTRSAGMGQRSLWMPLLGHVRRAIRHGWVQVLRANPAEGPLGEEAALLLLPFFSSSFSSSSSPSPGWPWAPLGRASRGDRRAGGTAQPHTAPWVGSAGKGLHSPGEGLD